jgi:hypothetical protein
MMPETATECDERLIKIAAVYVLERGMPLQFAIELLSDRLKDKTEINERLTQFLSYVFAGKSPL